MGKSHRAYYTYIHNVLDVLALTTTVSSLSLSAVSLCLSLSTPSAFYLHVSMSVPPSLTRLLPCNTRSRIPRSSPSFQLINRPLLPSLGGPAWWFEFRFIGGLRIFHYAQHQSMSTSFKLIRRSRLEEPVESPISQYHEKSMTVAHLNKGHSPISRLTNS